MKEIAIVPIFFKQKSWPPIAIKSQDFGYKSLINRFLLLVKYWNAHELRYQVPFEAYILVFFIIFAASDRKGSGSKFLSIMAIAIYA